MDRKREGLPRRFWRELRSIGRLGREVWRLVRWRKRLALAGAVAVMMVAGLANTAIPVYLGRLVDSVNPESHRGDARSELASVAAGYLAILGLCYAVREGLNVLRRYLVENTCTRIDRDMSIRVISHLMKVDLSTVSRDQVGSLHGRITRSVDGLVRFLRLSFLDFLPALLTGSFALLAALAKEPWIALAMVGVAPVSIALTMHQLLTQKGVRLGLMRTREAMDGTVVEQLAGLDYIRAADTHGLEVRRVEDAAEVRRGMELRHHFEMSLFGCGKALNEGFFHLLVIASAIFLFLRGQVRYGDILTFSVLYMNIMAPLNEIHRFIDEAHESSLKVADLVEILSRPTDPSFEVATPAEPHVAVGEPILATRDLVVDYRTADGRPRRALRSLSMEIRHGETIGVAGQSGCGKSTWLRVLLRLTHPTGGDVSLGGVPLEAVGRETLGRMIGYVGQNPFIFSGTVAENIAYGSEGVPREEIERVARLACLHEEIAAMPDGYDSAVAERGQNLSGGQRQRIALARVFLKNPPVLMLDEATSALDNISERRVQRAIEAARRDRTVILVAHRLTTLLNADRILVFDDGRIVEVGTYRELVARGGHFAELVRSAGETSPSESPVASLAS